MGSLTEKNDEKLIDLLNERLAFERSGVKLYDKIVSEIARSKDAETRKLLKEMKEHRDEEKEHEEWLEEKLRMLGWDPSEDTPMSELVKTESRGIEQVILQERHEIPELFHALLAAELVDNAGWELLLELADQADDAQARKEFKKRLHEEEDHLQFVREVMAKFATREVLGSSQEMPAD